MQKPSDRVHYDLLFYLREMRALFAPVKSDAQVVQRVLDAGQPGVATFLHWRHGFGWRARLRWRRLLAVVFAMDERMSRSSALDFPEANEVSALEIPIPMLEFPHGRLGGSVVEHVAHWPGRQQQQPGRTRIHRNQPL
jgi:hypothetical protein